MINPSLAIICQLQGRTQQRCLSALTMIIISLVLITVIVCTGRGLKASVLDTTYLGGCVVGLGYTHPELILAPTTYVQTITPSHLGESPSYLRYLQVDRKNTIPASPSRHRYWSCGFQTDFTHLKRYY